MTDKTLYLVNPPNPHNMKGFPGSLLALDLWVRDHVPGVDSTIIDEEETSEDNLRLSLESKLAEAPEDSYFGVTCTTATYQDALTTARAIKDLKPNSTVILGGHHLSGQENIVLDNHPEIDLTVTGEGEYALESILKGDLNTPGVTQRITQRYTLPVIGQETNLENKGKRLDRTELNNLTIDRFNNEYQEKSTQFEEVNLVTARGCPMKCEFCAVGDNSINSQDSETVVDQLDYLINQMQARGKSKPIAIQDNLFGQTPTRGREMAEALIDYRNRTGNDFEFNIQTRVGMFADKGLAKLMSKAGCSAAYFGVENFDPKILENMIKARNVKNYQSETRDAITNCLENGIDPMIDFQVGYRGEDQETEQINIKALEEIGRAASNYPDNKVMVFPSLSVVYPGTELYRKMVESGVPEDIYERFTEWERENESYRNGINGYFAHGNGGIPLSIMDTEKLKDGYSLDDCINTDKLDQLKSYVEDIRNIEEITVHQFEKEKRENA